MKLCPFCLPSRKRHELRRPDQGHAVRPERTGRTEADPDPPRLRGCNRRDGRRGARGERALHGRGGRAAEPHRRRRAGEVGQRPRDHDAGLQAGVRRVRAGGLAGRAASGRVRRTGPAQGRRCAVHGDAAVGEPVVRAVSAADRRRHRGAADGRQRRAEVDLHPSPDRRQLDRDDEPHRAAGRVRPRAGAHAGGAAGRRHVPPVRPEDLHHLRRARPRREHRAPRARAHAGRARGRQGHLALHRAEVPVRRRGQAGQAQRRVLRVDRAQARHQREPDLRAAVRRRQGRGRAGRDRATHRPGESRPRVHVHHDERRALPGRHAGHRGVASAPTSRRSGTPRTASRAGRSKARPGRCRSSAIRTCAGC